MLVPLRVELPSDETPSPKISLKSTRDTCEMDSTVMTEWVKAEWEHFHRSKLTRKEKYSSHIFRENYAKCLFLYCEFLKFQRGTVCGRDGDTANTVFKLFKTPEA